jgi:hypothetical protein
MNRQQMQKELVTKTAQLTESQERQGRQRKEIVRLERKIDAMKSAPVPQGGSEDYQQGVADAVMAIWRAMENA